MDFVSGLYTFYFFTEASRIKDRRGYHSTLPQTKMWLVINSLYSKQQTSAFKRFYQTSLILLHPESNSIDSV